MTQTQYDQVSDAWQVARDFLSGRQTGSHWSGQLSTSALSTATAISAMAELRRQTCVPDQLARSVDAAIDGGCAWLAARQNSDGGFGDTDRSHSNIATTLLVIAAWHLADERSATQLGNAQELDSQEGSTQNSQHLAQIDQAWRYVDARGRWEGLRRRYGKDKTFVVPILSNCALAGLVPWKDVPALPFEAAWLPQDWYRWARMPVVSYAVPALVAIGQARFIKQPPRSRLLCGVRRRALRPTLEVLRKMQPASGGYLEAVPLTAFVLMNLAAVGNGSLQVAQEGLRFILDSRLADGSWPIDTNLATWLTSLSVTAISRRSQGRVPVIAGASLRNDAEMTQARETKSLPRCEVCVDARTVRWLLSCQHLQRHPFTGATPGGWGWTNLSGAVPDADDTPAALLALRTLDFERPELSRLRHEVHVAVGRGLGWLLRLQNRDGGWPTFCRGWGKLPFDRSGTDLTAHALRAIHAWRGETEQMRRLESGVPSDSELQRAMHGGLRYLARHQSSEGAWLPLWFGNQDRPEEDNPVYGTGKVLFAYAELGLSTTQTAEKGVEYLRRSQNPDGGWGGGLSGLGDGKQLSGQAKQTAETWEKPGIYSSIEETAIALEGLIQCAGEPSKDATIMRGVSCLVDKVRRGELQQASPIGFYFAKLWYYEYLYPSVFTVAALGAALRAFDKAHERLGLKEMP